MSNLALHPMKEIRIIIQGEHLKFATDLLDNKATGYTIIHNITGKGHHGFHTAHRHADVGCRAGKSRADFGWVKTPVRPLHRSYVCFRRCGQPRRILFAALRFWMTS